MSSPFCQQPTLDGFLFCHSCIKGAISNTQQSQKELIPTMYNISHQSLSSSIPENGECNYRMARGEFKGWYCSNPSHPNLAYCERCINKVAKFGYGTKNPKELNLYMLCVENKLCTNIL
jgi:hypothetical protein